MCGSVTQAGTPADMVQGVSTDAKKTPVSALRGPGAPVLSKTLIRPLAMAMIWVGPTSPMLSGGMKRDSPGGLVDVIARKFTPGIWGDSSDSAAGPAPFRGGPCET